MICELQSEESAESLSDQSIFPVSTITKSGDKSRRIRERIGLKLPVRVHGRDSIDHDWAEMSHLVDVTPFGARLRLKRPTETGRLLLLTLNMPRQFRCFDHAEDQYRVWSLVRNVKMLDANQEKGALIELGVAFVGKRPPPSFERDPARRYEIAKATTVGGLWVVTEEGSGQLAEVSNSGDKRKESRHSIPIEVLIEVFDEKGALTLSERTVTENLSRHGAAVFTSMDVSPGRFVKVTSEHQGNSVLAVVRSCRRGPDNVPRLHLEFVGGDWEL